MAHRNFGLHRRGQLFRDFWHANDNEPESPWPARVLVAAVVLMVVIGIFA